MMAATFVPIQSVTLASSAASVTFSAIPQTYTDLVVRLTMRSTVAAQQSWANWTVSGLSGTNYSETWLAGNGASASSGRYSSQASFQDVYITGANATSNCFAVAEIYIPNYATAAYKQSSVTSFVEYNNATAQQLHRASLLSNTAAVTSIVVSEGTGANFVAGCTFHLYGIKNS